MKEQSGYMNNSVSSSPRSKATRVSYSQSEYHLMVGFVKQNMKLFLRLISSDIHNKEVSLSATEFNTLRILFKVQSTDGKSLESRPTSASSSKMSMSSMQMKQLSHFAPFYMQPASTTSSASGQSSAKVHMSTIMDWIISLLAIQEPMENLYKLNSLNKCMNVKTYQDLYPHYQDRCCLSIQSCEDSNIYIDSTIQNVLISSCINCTIFIAAVSKVCTIEKCENSTMVVAANEVRIGSCIDTLVHSYTPLYPPIVYGDTRNLRLAPHNANYDKLSEHLVRAGIKFEQRFDESGKQMQLSDWFIEAINNFRKPVVMAKSNKSERTDS